MEYIHNSTVIAAQAVRAVLAYYYSNLTLKLSQSANFERSVIKNRFRLKHKLSVYLNSKNKQKLFASLNCKTHSEPQKVGCYCFETREKTSLQI